MAACSLFKALRDEDALTGRPTQHDYNDMVRRRRRELSHITEQLAEGKITPDLWADRFDAILLAGHSRAHHLGRRLAGDLRGFNNGDMSAGLAAKDKDGVHLFDFVQAIKDRDPRYVDEDGNIRTGPITNRANLYLGRMRGTAGHAFVGACDPDEKFDWLLGGVEHHCEDCPQMAAISPFDKSTLWTTPGDGDTECLGNCKCRLRRRSDRLSCFGPEDPTEGVANPREGTAPVSDAIDNQAAYPASAHINRAIGLIDQTHSDGVLPETQVYAIIDAPDLGGYFDPVNLEIAINIFGSTPIGTTIHETGHLIDLFGMGRNGKPASTRSRLTKEWRDAIKGTESFQRIQAIKAGGVITVAGEEIEIDEGMQAHAAYLNRWEEYWARSYDQFIRTRTKDKNLLAEAENLLNSSYQKIFKAQWDDRDFAAVEAAILALFQKLGWMAE